MGSFNPAFIYGPVILIVIILLIYCCVINSKRYRINRAMKKTPRMWLAGIPHGTVARVVGQVQYLQNLVLSPMTNRPCVYYMTRVEEYRVTTTVTRDANGVERVTTQGNWYTVIYEEGGVDFLVLDGSGVAHVRVEQSPAYSMMVNVVPDNFQSSGTFHNATPNAEMFLRRHGMSSETFFGFNKQMRYTEGIFTQNQMVALVGRYDVDPFAPQGAQWLIVGAPNKQQVQNKEAFETRVIMSNDPSHFGVPPAPLGMGPPPPYTPPPQPQAVQAVIGYSNAPPGTAAYNASNPYQNASAPPADGPPAYGNSSAPPSYSDPYGYQAPANQPLLQQKGYGAV